MTAINYCIVHVCSEIYYIFVFEKEKKVNFLDVMTTTDIFPALLNVSANTEQTQKQGHNSHICRLLA